MHIRYPAGALLLACVPVLHAAQSGHPGSVDAETLGSVVVTASRTERPRGETLAPTTVVTREDIERLQLRSVGEVLRRAPGVSLSNNGGPGKATSIFMRGTESDHVLVLVDGVEIGSATNGQAAIQDLPVEQIERVEIVRGPRSALYGSEAIGGVIQIFTRDGGESARPYFSVGAGSYDTYEAQAGLSGGNERAHYNLSVSGRDSEGFDACTAAAGGTGGCFVDEPDDDGYERLSGSLNAGYRFANGLRWNLHLLRVEGDNEFDGSFANQAETRQQVFGTSLAWRPLPEWETELSLGRSVDEADNFLDGTFASAFETERDTATWQNDWSPAPGNLLTLGLDYQKDEIASSTGYAETARDNAGAFAEYQGDWGAHHLQLAVRGDDNEQFGDHVTGSAAWGWDLGAGYRASLSYGTAFKAPTFNELYFPGFSNPDLEPEESDSVEIGLDARRDWGHWSLHAYQTRVDELIENFDPTPDQPFNGDLRPANISEARIRGVEAGLGTELARWHIDAGLTWLDAENRSDGANRGNELPRRPEHSAQLDIDRPFGRYNLGLSLYVAGDTYDDAENTRELDGYELVSLRGGMRLTGAWRLQARVNNLLDQDYQTAGFYNQPDANVFVTLRYQPE